MSLPPAPTNQPPSDDDESSDFGALEKLVNDEGDKVAASGFMKDVASWLVQSKPGPIDEGTEVTVREAAQADAAKVPIFMAAVMRRKVLWVIRLWEGLEKAFDKLMESADEMDAEEAGILFDRLCREEDRHMKSIMALKTVIEGIDWAEIEAIVQGGERRVKASARLPLKDRQRLREVFKKALVVGVQTDNPADDDVEEPGLMDEEPEDAGFSILDEPEDPPL